MKILHLPLFLLQNLTKTLKFPVSERFKKVNNTIHIPTMTQLQ